MTLAGMQTRGIQNPENCVDVIYVWPLSSWQLYDCLCELFQQAEADPVAEAHPAQPDPAGVELPLVELHSEHRYVCRMFVWRQCAQSSSSQ